MDKKNKTPAEVETVTVTMSRPVVLTCGIDVQDDRFELELVGWGVGKESWGMRNMDGRNELVDCRTGQGERLCG